MKTGIRNLIRSSVMCCIILAMVLGVAAGSEHPLLKEAKKEGKAIFYANITGVEPVMQAFKSQYGVSAEYTRVSTAVYVPTVQTEFQAGRLAADVLQAPIPILQILKDAGVLAKYVSPVSEKYPKWSRDPDGVIQQFGIEAVAIIYNTELVKPQDVPTTYRDLANPKWRDKIVMPDPITHATTITWLVGLKEHVFSTEAEWMEFLRGLAKNRPMFVASFGPTPGPIETGEKVIGISMPKYIVTKAPAPLGWAKLNGEPLMGSARGIAVAKNAKRPNAARLFVDFWLSEASSRILAEQVGEWVLYEGIYPPIEGIKKADVIPLRELSDDEIQRWSEVFKTIF
ncbi:MAG TPA: extracellular solute-binding protein [Bacillota bacterium]|jgi:iron(III) transport system substrate-binding protein|nr:extracellular solute-binding protein [Bacillota bacterium]